MGREGRFRNVKSQRIKKTDRKKERRGHDGFGLLVLPSGQLADLFI